MKIIVPRVEMRSFEIRKSSAKNAQNPTYCLLYFEDQDGASNHVLCRDQKMLEDNFSKGIVCDLICIFEKGQYTRFELESIDNIGIYANS